MVLLSGCAPRRNPLGSSQNFIHHLAFHIRQPEIAALETVGQLRVIEAETMENGGVQIVHVNLILGHVETEFIGLAKGHAGLDAAAGQPDGEGLWMMVAAQLAPEVGVGLDHGRCGRIRRPK